MTRKLKLYLDTSVISHIFAPHKPVEERITKQFFQFIENHHEEFALYLSGMVINELNSSPEPFWTIFSDFLAKLPYHLIDESIEAQELLESYRKEQVLEEKHLADLTHIANAVVARCDYIISWNRKHFVNVRTISLVNAVNQTNNFCGIFIVTPTFILGDTIDEFS